MKDHTYFVYILTNYQKTVLYTGVTNSLEKRMQQHRLKLNNGFAAKFNCDRLIYFETFGEITEAIYREKQIKKYPRKWKANLINAQNPDWEDLSADWDI